jgi:transcription elongation factor GreA
MSTVARRPEPITRAGYERLKAELDHLVNVRRRQLAEDLREAREDGGEPGENTAVSAALDVQAAVERRIDELEALLADVEIVEPPEDGVAGIGQRVTLRMAPGAAPVEYELVGPMEADPAERRISIASPVGRSLVGHRAGDKVEVEVPAGRRTVEIVAVGASG